MKKKRFTEEQQWRFAPRRAGFSPPLMEPARRGGAFMVRWAMPGWRRKYADSGACFRPPALIAGESDLPGEEHCGRNWRAAARPTRPRGDRRMLPVFSARPSTAHPGALRQAQDEEPG